MNPYSPRFLVYVECDHGTRVPTAVDVEKALVGLGANFPDIVSVKAVRVDEREPTVAGVPLKNLHAPLNADAQPRDIPSRHLQLVRNVFDGEGVA